MANEHALTTWRNAQKPKVSQIDLAGMLGVSRWMVNRIEKGERNPSLKLAIKVQEITDGAVTAKDFAGRAAQ